MKTLSVTRFKDLKVVILTGIKEATCDKLIFPAANEGSTLENIDQSQKRKL
jgi:hypothetical protein